VVERYARRLEAEIRESPADWLWVHNKWKYPKPDAPAQDAGRRAADGVRMTAR
jgi:lauroyl/myristoyl acyltransferase